jgi:hypothetical protein
MAAAEDVPDEPIQPDRPAPMRRGFRPVPQVEEQQAAVAVDGFPLLPLGNQSDAGWELHPKGSAGLAWDANPLSAVGGSDGDMQGRLAAGAELRINIDERWRADLAGMYRIQRYADTPGRDFAGGDAELRLRRADEGSFVAILGNGEKTSEPQANLPELVERQRLRAEAGGAFEERSSRTGFALAWSRLDYLEDGPYFGRDERDDQRLEARASWSRLGAGDSLLGIEASLGRITHPAAALANDADVATVGGRWRHAVGRRTAVDLRLGATLRLCSDDTAGDPANDDDRLVAPAGGVGVEWSWEERSRLGASFSTGLDEGLTAEANACRRLALVVTGRQRLLDRLDLTGQGWLIHRRDSGTADPTRGREEALDAFVRLGFDYRLRDGLGLRFWASGQAREAELAGSYTRSMVALELVAAL